MATVRLEYGGMRFENTAEPQEIKSTILRMADRHGIELALNGLSTMGAVGKVKLTNRRAAFSVHGTLYRATPLNVRDAEQLGSAVRQRHDPVLTGEPQNDNDARAAWAGRALAWFAMNTGDLDEDLETVLSDLLSDLRHLADALEVDYGNADERAERHYQREIEGGRI